MLATLLLTVFLNHILNHILNVFNSRTWFSVHCLSWSNSHYARFSFMVNFILCHANYTWTWQHRNYKLNLDFILIQFKFNLIIVWRIRSNDNRSMWWISNNFEKKPWNICCCFNFFYILVRFAHHNLCKFNWLIDLPVNWFILGWQLHSAIPGQIWHCIVCFVHCFRRNTCCLLVLR